MQAYTQALQLAPRRYTTAMQALLGRRAAYEGLGQRGLQSADSRREFLWGRGVRWPGWYIIAAILLRNEVVKGM